MKNTEYVRRDVVRLLYYYCLLSSSMYHRKLEIQICVYRLGGASS